MTVVTVAALGVANRPLVAEAMDRYYDYQASQPDYQAKNGRWDILPVPAKFKINAIHAALLPTGKVLIVAGSGNRRENFEAGSFRTMVWDPSNNHFKLVSTPVDLFCGGHAFLPDGKLVVAGGTRRYEVLPAQVKRAAGTMQVVNENPNRSYSLGKGVQFKSKTTGIVYHSTQAVTVPPATKVGKGKATRTVGTQAGVFVEAVKDSKHSGVNAMQQFTVDAGLKGQDAKDVHAHADDLDYGKQEYQGLNDSFEFNPWTEEYERVGNMNDSRWYPTLAPLADSSILAVSGLNQFGGLVSDTEKYNAATKKWVNQPQLKKEFPTYPALFLTENSKLFFTGSSSGYGQKKSQRKPGFWDVKTNKFTEVPGLQDVDKLETSASVMLAPAQDQKIMVLGGGKNGDSKVSTRRTSVIDLKAANPSFKRTADLPSPTRYLNAVLLPNDTVFTSNGSKDYRGRGESDLYDAQIYHPDSDTFEPVAKSHVGRNYHSEGLLLPDGRIVTLGGDPLYKSNTDTSQGDFEQRIEIYTPAYLLNGTKRPTITAGPKLVKRGKTYHFSTPDAANLKSARLMRPSSVTHVTDVEQRSLALDMKVTGDGVDLTMPAEASLAPSGYWMLIVNSKEGTPSVAKWVSLS